MSKVKLALHLISLTVVSCGTVVKNLAGFKNPKVEDKQVLNNYFKEVLPNESIYFMKVDKAGNKMEIINNLVLGMNAELLLFSASGEKYCYLGTEECGGIQMQNAFNSFKENYSPCKEENALNMTTYLKKLVDINGKTLAKEHLVTADFYIFQNWNKYSGSKKKLKEDLNWLLDLKKNSNLNVALIFVNGDMLQEWGLEKNGKLPLKFKKEGKEFTMTFGELPLKK